ncbi:MAG TPA: flavin reductase family protein [Actinoplanes sp.]|nr:flavin reductase family protein [Actinoplanes sp.]
MSGQWPTGAVTGWAEGSRSVGMARLVAEMARRQKRRVPLPYTTELDVPAPAAFGDEFRRVMSAFPSGVSVVTARDSDGLPRGLTCSSLCSLSMDPPMMLVCVNRRNGSLAAIRASGGFAVNLLRDGRSAVSDEFASASPDKFSRVRWRPSPRSGLPWLLDDALAFVDCRLVADLAAGSHTILIGLVVDGRDVPEEGATGTATADPEDRPLVYWRRRYHGFSQPAD